MATTTGPGPPPLGGRRPESSSSGTIRESDPVDGVVGVEPHRGPQLDPLGHGRRSGPAHGPGQGDRLRRGGGSPVPMHTMRVTPASPARAMVAASRVACGPEVASAPGSVNSSWRWQWESNHSIDRVVHAGLARAQALRRGKSGAPFVTGRPPG